jgi:TatD DNase family protein
MSELTDSHVHLDDEGFDADREAVISRAIGAGVSRLIVPAIHRASWDKVRRLSDAAPGIHPAYGLHPIFLADHRPEHLDELARWLREHRAVAVGEIGLDFFLPELDRDSQRSYFHRQLEIAREFDLPVILHARAALEEVTLAIRRTGGLRGVVHSFSGSLVQAGQLWNLGFHMGIGGPVTYERAQRLRGIVANMPIEFLLLETDAPDQPDANHRGQRNEPARLREVLRTVAALRQTSEDELAAATTDNARRLFAID